MDSEVCSTETHPLNGAELVQIRPN